MTDATSVGQCNRANFFSLISQDLIRRCDFVAGVSQAPPAPRRALGYSVEVPAAGEPEILAKTLEIEGSECSNWGRLELAAARPALCMQADAPATRLPSGHDACARAGCECRCRAMSPGVHELGGRLGAWSVTARVLSQWTPVARGSRLGDPLSARSASRCLTRRSGRVHSLAFNSPPILRPRLPPTDMIDVFVSIAQ